MNFVYLRLGGPGRIGYLHPSPLVEGDLISRRTQIDVSKSGDSPNISRLSPSVLGLDDYSRCILHLTPRIRSTLFVTFFARGDYLLASSGKPYGKSPRRAMLEVGHAAGVLTWHCADKDCLGKNTELLKCKSIVEPSISFPYSRVVHCFEGSPGKDNFTRRAHTIFQPQNL